MIAALAAVLCTLTLAPGAAGQQPMAVTPASAVEVKPGTIRGQITAADTGKPLRRARVTVLPASEGSAGRRVVAGTNASGRYEVKDVPPGTYFVSAGRAGYVTLQYGQRRARERGLTVEVRGEQAVERIDVALPSAGILAGRITDELGEPYPGVEVDVLATAYNRGRRELAPIGGGRTDDLGQYRIAGLQPGAYYVVATSSETWRTETKETFGYGPTFYPGAAFDGAQLLVLGASEQRRDLNFSVIPSRTARVSGRVQRESGEGIPAAQVELAYSYPGAIVVTGARFIRTDGSGAFEFKDVPPGTYSVGGGSADQTVTVAGADVDNVILVPKTGSTVTGTIVTDTETPPPFPPSGVRVRLDAPAGKVLPTVRIVPVGTDWSFKLTGLGGPFLFRVSGIPDDWTLASVQLGEKDISDVLWDVPTGGKELSGLKIVVTQRIGKVSGVVLDDRGAPTSQATIVIFPDDPDLWQPGSRMIRATRPSRDGRFLLAGLPSGTYRALARDFVEDGQWEDRAFLDANRELATRFVLGEGATEAMTLRLPPPK